MRKILDAGRLGITDFGIFGSLDDRYFAAGFNAFRETDGELAIGEMVDMGSFRVEGTEYGGRPIDAPPAFLDCGDPDKQRDVITENRRAMLQLFGVKVHVFPDGIKVRGSIPTQVLELANNGFKATATTGPIISSVRGHRGWGVRGRRAFARQERIQGECPVAPMSAQLSQTRIEQCREEPPGCRHPVGRYRCVADTCYTWSLAID